MKNCSRDFFSGNLQLQRDICRVTTKISDAPSLSRFADVPTITRKGKERWPCMDWIFFFFVTPWEYVHSRLFDVCPSATK